MLLCISKILSNKDCWGVALVNMNWPLHAGDIGSHAQMSPLRKPCNVWAFVVDSDCFFGLWPRHAQWAFLPTSDLKSNRLESKINAGRKWHKYVTGGHFEFVQMIV